MLKSPCYQVRCATANTLGKLADDENRPMIQKESTSPPAF
ncbi:hypothetical protein GXN76_12095 [Kroppenstedtia pulmonis]|uniref:HEAT repeat domain-containing protein n=2 Tax=Kroppenstedtia pulmonis TaxID=1380685 RepID=A0A7D4C7X3_9BACL|nr:hypothetical protein GXN76_12095 [Kroppenstedtia pulmonis]